MTQPPDPPKRRASVEDCDYCDRYKGSMMPSHDPSTRCQSGGRNHCTCDTCF